LIQLLTLLHRARDAAIPAELAFIAVNETAGLVPFRQAALWEAGRGITAVSGVPEPEVNAPFTLWLERVCRQLGAKPAGAMLADDLSSEDRTEWSDWLPAQGWWQPLPQGNGGLLFARDDAWTEQEAALLAELAHAYGHALAALRRPSLLSEWKTKAHLRRKTLRFAAAAFLVLAVIPVPLTVLAPAEVVAAHPAVIRSPQEGVVARLQVRPGERVAEGQPLFELDDTQLAGKAEVAEKTLAAADAEWRQLSQQALFDPAAKPKLAAAQGRRDQQAAELDYLHSLLARIRVKAPSGGITVLDDPSEWIGRPVAVGEKVLSLAEEHDTEIEAWLSPADAIKLKPGAPVSVFLNVSPLFPVHAAVTSLAYEATPRPDATMAYRVRARILGDGEKPRLGLKGTARLSGRWVPLSYWLLRRPIGAVRSALGL